MNSLRVLIPWYRYPPQTSLSIGGLSVAITTLVETLRERQIEVEILCPSEDASTKENLSRDSSVNGPAIRRNLLGEKIAIGRSLSSSDKKYLGDFDHIISVNNFGAKSLSELPNRNEAVLRQIHTVAHDRPISSYVQLKPSFFEMAKMYAYRSRERQSEKSLKGTRTMCVSKYNLNKMKEYQIELEQNLSHIPNAIDVTLFKPMMTPKKFDLIFIGRFQKFKGLDILLGTLNILLDQAVRPHAAIIGPFSPGQQKYCRNLLRREIRDNVSFLGLISHTEIPRLLNSSKALVVPSTYESFSLPTLEAVACGIPVVASEVGGIPELLNQNTGILVSPKNERMLANAITKALDSGRLSESSLKSGPLVARDYDLKTIGSNIVEFLK